MYDRIEIFQLAHGLASHAGARQAKIAGNIANADTPDYRAQDLKPFAETYQAQRSDTALRRTRDSHGFGADPSALTFQTIDRPGASAPNGNTVSLETEMMKATEVRQAHEMALSVYQTSLGILRTSLGRGR
ncbi:MAG: FlgB family protein [Rhodobacteraceae bacterium]|nr:FlgB family protein [Paracoccaceae bacterium]